MRAVKALFILIFVLALGLISSSAQDTNNDPRTNPDANACNEGGSMEGKCNTDSNGDGVVSAEEVAWSWTCGWHLIRFEQGLITEAQFPSDCAILLSYIPDPECFFGGLWYSGVPNVDGNFLLFVDKSFDPTGCWGESVASTFPSFGGVLEMAIVTGANEGEAVANCMGIYDAPIAGVAPIEGNLWLCIAIII